MKNIRKVIIPLLLLTLLLVAGCDNQKAIDNAIAEEEQKVLDFMDTYGKACDCISTFDNKNFYKTWDFSEDIYDAEGKENMPLYSLLTYLLQYLGQDGTTGIPSHEGILEIGKKDDGTFYINATGVKITNVYNNKETPLTFDCYISKKVTSDETDGEVITEYKVPSLEINGKEYKPIHAIVSSNGKKGKFTLALVGEDKASLDILNALYYNYNKQ